MLVKAGWYGKRPNVLDGQKIGGNNWSRQAPIQKVSDYTCNDCLALTCYRVIWFCCLYAWHHVSKAYAGEIPVTICRGVHSRDVAPLHAIRLPLYCIYINCLRCTKRRPGTVSNATIYSTMAVTVIQIKSAWFIS